MGIYDRDYYRDAPRNGGFAYFSIWSVTTWLIVLNIAVFFVDGATKRWQTTSQEQVTVENDSDGFSFQSPAEGPPLLTQWGSFSIDTAIRRVQAWRFFTYQFLHAHPWHLIVNMLGLYLFGPIVEGHFGSRRYIAFYLLCGLAGAACFTLMALLGVLHTGPQTPLIGSSASIFGLLVAAAMIAPDVQVFYYFFPITIRFLAIAGMLLAVYTVMSEGGSMGQNAGGEAAHLGGGALGYLLWKNQHWLNPFAPRAFSGRSMSPGTRPRGRPGRRTMQKDWSKDLNR